MFIHTGEHHMKKTILFLATVLAASNGFCVDGPDSMPANHRNSNVSPFEILSESDLGKYAKASVSKTCSVSPFEMFDESQLAKYAQFIKENPAGTPTEFFLRTE